MIPKDIQKEIDEVFVHAFNKEKYGWSKWSGGFHGMVGNEQDWSCQACGKQQCKELPRYKLALENSMTREYVSICSICKHVQKTYSLNYKRLVYKVRNHG